MKLPGQFRDLFAKPRQLDEDTGEYLAKWAAGGTARSPVDVLLDKYATCDADGFAAAEIERASLWPSLKGRRRDQEQIIEAKERAVARLKEEQEYESANGTEAA